MKKYQAILWDCDGVLIDSEYIACSISAGFLGSVGYQITTEKFIENFMGKSRIQIMKELEAETGRDFLTLMDKSNTRQELKKAFEKDLRASEGMEDVLRAIHLPMAVASGSDMDRLNFSLGLTNLAGYFKGHIYSSESMPNGKPAPDIFLHAAKQLGVAPEGCLVIEDGIHGIHAAKAAGMDVLAFTGGTHMTPALKATVLAQKPDGVLTHMTQLLDYLGLRTAA